MCVALKLYMAVPSVSAWTMLSSAIMLKCNGWKYMLIILVGRFKTGPGNIRYGKVQNSCQSFHCSWMSSLITPCANHGIENDDVWHKARATCSSHVTLQHYHCHASMLTYLWNVCCWIHVVLQNANRIHLHVRRYAIIWVWQHIFLKEGWMSMQKILWV